MNRKDQFDQIRNTLQSRTVSSTDDCLIVAGDSLASLKCMPSHSVSLILTDPPYHVTKKQNIYGDRAFKDDPSYLEWMRSYAVEWQRILKPNGSLFCYCASSMSARLEVMLGSYFNVLSHIVWTKPNAPGFDGWKGKVKKESLRKWYPHSERIIFAEPVFEDNHCRSSFADLLKTSRIKAGLTGHRLTEMIGAYGEVNHGGAVSNWESGRNVPSREQYARICDTLISTQQITSMPDYEDAIRPFHVNKTKEFTDVWTFPSVRPYKGKHPAEKPIEMLEHAIESTTFTGDIVVDCFAGSGNTAIAACHLGRRSVVMEFDDQLLVSMKKRLIEYE